MKKDENMVAKLDQARKQPPTGQYAVNLTAMLQAARDGKVPMGTFLRK